MKILLPSAAAAVMQRLRQHQINTWVIGGAVRDSLLDRPVSGWDLTADCTLQQLVEALPDAKPVGGTYDTVCLHGIMIAPCRTGSEDGGLRADLARRDFTVNAMAWDGEVVTDPYHGRYDLLDRVLRCVGEPQQRFAEDALRILRLYRFAAVLDFIPEPATEAAALRMAGTVGWLGTQQVRAELEKALAGVRPSALWPLIATGGLRPFGLWAEPEVIRQAQAAGQNPLLPLDAVPAVLLLRWWVLAKLCGCGLYRLETALGLGRTFARDVNRLDGFYTAGMPADRQQLKQRLMNPLPVPDDALMLALAAADPAFEELPGLYAALAASREPYRVQHLRITPAELLTEGVPAKKIGAVQQCLLQAVVDSPELNVWPTLARMAQSLKKLV